MAFPRRPAAGATRTATLLLALALMVTPTS